MPPLLGEPLPNHTAIMPPSTSTNFSDSQINLPTLEEEGNTPTTRSRPSEEMQFVSIFTIYFNFNYNR